MRRLQETSKSASANSFLCNTKTTTKHGKKKNPESALLERLKMSLTQNSLGLQLELGDFHEAEARGRRLSGHRDAGVHLVLRLMLTHAQRASQVLNCVPAGPAAR